MQGPNNPYISILKLKSSLVDVSVVAITCAVLGAWDLIAVVAAIAGIMIHSGCDIMNDIYDIEIDKICKPDGAISSGQMTLKNAWIYMLLLFLAALIISLTMGTILFTCLLTGIVVGGILYSHLKFRLKDTPGMGNENEQYFIPYFEPLKRLYYLQLANTQISVHAPSGHP